LTIHGKSRFPGLNIWSRQGKKVQVRVPDGCLLIQAGLQLEHLTGKHIHSYHHLIRLGGYVQAGFHEVVVLKDTLEAMEKAKQQGRSLWRVSSTLFLHIATDHELSPLHQFKTKESTLEYPPILAGEKVQRELECLDLKH
jgi:isopenicillin N synthase-like dioxygenase